MSASNAPTPIQPIDTFTIQTITGDDVKTALSNGLADFKITPLISMFFGLMIALFGIGFSAGLLLFDQIWLIVAAGVGFPLIAPFLAAGFYEMSRRYESGEPFIWSDIVGVIFRQQRREFGWMAFVMLFVFWVWVYQVRLLLALFLQWTSFSSLDGFLVTISTTTNGLLFIGVGTIIGAVLATVLFSITVISMPLLLDQEIDFVSAMILSVKSVMANPLVMLGWGIVIAVITFIAMLPGFLGLIIAVPILGHATWHLYRKVLIKSV
ncbi:DUF2189 domain-containing protein [Pseudahrensia aquimaris]|uniref:DUF2189 domain-containing protein n=1 Tax=Pseudahrensia aquimaris TaxID=744461 RepID=A0ABW3FBE7_9HYPH